MLSISFTGDVCVNGRFADNLKAGLPLVDIHLEQYLKKQPFICCNFEGAETETNFVINKGTPLKNGTGSIAYLNGLGFNIFNLANNHIFDGGIKGLTDSIDLINKANTRYIGAGINFEDASKPIILKMGSISVALLAISDKVPNQAKKNKSGVFGFNKRQLKIAVKKLKTECNWVVVMFHGGEEYSLYPSPAKRKKLHWICNNTSTDVVISHHSHTFQGFEKVNGKLVFYSLGNFIFDLINHEIFPHTNEGAIVTLTFTPHEIVPHFYPVYCHSAQGMVISGNEKFVDTIHKLSDFSNYRNFWQKECYRLIFNRTEHPVLNPKGGSLQNKSIVRWAGSIKFYKQLYRLVKNRDLASIYLNAYLYKLKHQSHGSSDL